MNEIITMCGYRCDLCPAYEPNIKNPQDRQNISDGWKRYFGFNIPAEEIGCAGCRNEGKHADKDCPVRPCVIEKGLYSCAGCDGFICEKLKTRVEFVENLKNKEDIPEEDFHIFIQPYRSRERLMKMRK